MSIYSDWIEAKAAEKAAQDKRRAIEDIMISSLGVAESLDGTMTIDEPGYKIKIVGRMNRKVDGDKLQEVAREAGFEDILSSLFRWKPEINLATWKNTDTSITSILAKAITVEPGRPSFTIEERTNG
jgi:hypothetical protein